MWIGMMKNKLEGFLFRHVIPQFWSHVGLHGYLSKYWGTSPKEEYLNSHLLWLKEAFHCLDMWGSLEKQLANCIKFQCATSQILQSRSIEGRGWEDYARTWTVWSSSTVLTPRGRTRTWTTTLTQAWRSGLLTLPADAFGHKEVKICLDEEENLDDCAVRKVDEEADDNANPRIEERFVGTRIPDRHICGPPEAAPCWVTIMSIFAFGEHESRGPRECAVHGGCSHAASGGLAMGGVITDRKPKLWRHWPSGEPIGD